MGPSVSMSVPRFLHGGFASGFCNTPFAQSHMSDAVMYAAPPAAPAPLITAPAQTRATDTVMYKALFDICPQVRDMGVGRVNPRRQKMVKIFFLLFCIWSVSLECLQPEKT